MRKIVRTFIVAFLAMTMVFSAGCGSSASSKKTTDTKANTSSNADSKTSDSSETREITDVLGNKVTIKKDIKKVIALPWPITSAVCAIDQSSDRIAGMPAGSKKSYEKCILKSMYPELANVTTDFVDNSGVVNIEEVKKLNPDVAFMYKSHEAQAKKLAEIGIPTVMLKYGTIEDFKKTMKVIGEVLNKGEQADKIIKYTQDTQTYLDTKKSEVEAADKPKILYLYNGELKVASKTNINTGFMTATGAENVAKDVDGDSWVTVTMEQVMQWNPDMIYVSNFCDVTPEDLYNNKIKGQDWSNIAAIKNKKVFKTPMGIYRWDAPSVEEPLMMRWMAKTQQPDIFKDFDMKEEIKTYYKTMFNYDLKDEEMDNILSTKYNGK